MIKKIIFIKITKLSWIKKDNNKAVMHNNGVQFFEDDKLRRMVPFSQIKEIIYE